MKIQRLPEITIKLIINSFLFILLLNFDIAAQVTLQKKLSNINSLQEVLTEKVHLHIDRDIFTPGEDVWFKAYLLEGTLHIPTSTSHNLHVDLISPNGIIIDSKTIMLNNGVGFGDFHIVEGKYPEGKYQLRAYTNFMRNFGKGIFFTKDILITDFTTDKEKTIKSIKPEIDLHFFPEGGNLIQNVTNKVAFKAIDKSGRGVNIKLSLFDEGNKLIKNATSFHNGMGYINFLPEPNKKYYAIIDSVGIEDKKYYLPNQVNGYSIFVGNQFKNLLDFQVNTSPDNVLGQKLKYTIQSRGILFTVNEVVIDKPQNRVRVEKEKLPEGISCITLYDENDIPVCERLIFNQSFKKVQIHVHADKSEYQPREKVNLTIETKDEQGNPLPSNLSLSVIDQYINQVGKKVGLANANIVPSILLNADLKGKIEDPAFYFENFDVKKHFLLDLVLLTHGWRKYVWREMIEKESLSLNLDYERGFTFTGKVNKYMFKKPIPDSKVTLAMVENGISFQESRSDSTGNFRFDNIYLMDTTLVIFQAYNKRDRRNTVIDLDNNSYVPYRIEELNIQPVFYENTGLDEFAEQTNKMKRLLDSLAAKQHIFIDEVTVTAKIKKDDGHYRIYKEANHVIEVDDVMETYPDIFSMLRGRIPGVRVTGSCPEVQVIIRGFSSLTGNNSAGYILNGMFVDTEAMCTVNPFDVDKIEVLMGATSSIFGSRGGNGIVAVYTKKGPDRRVLEPIGILKEKQKGYYRAREFYAPDYDKPQDVFSGKDIRNTLFWEPFVTTDANGKAEISFFNSDKVSEYEIRIEGVGLSGGLGENSMKYEVVP